MSRPVKASPLVLLLTWKTMKSEIYVSLPFRSTVFASIVTARNRFSFGPSARAFLCKFLIFFSNAFFSHCLLLVD